MPDVPAKKTVDLARYKEEVESGLPNEVKLMDKALERQYFYDYEGERYQRYFRRDAESFQDFHERSHRKSGFLRECVGKLCAHLYSPGPSRRWSEDAGDEFLQGVYRDNLIDSLMLEADKLSTLNAAVAIQITAGEGEYDKKPITYRLWGREHFCVWTDPEDDKVVEAVCTKDMYNGQTRYRLWSNEEVWTFLTKLEQPGVGGGEPTSGGRAAVIQTKEPHEYGCLPFTFVHYELPIKCFDVVAIGEFLTKAEIAIDNRLMKLDESVDKHINPIPVAEGVEENWKPILGPQRFVRMPRAAPTLDSGGNYQPGEAARLYYLQATIDVGGAWDDLSKYIEQCLEASGIPKSAVRMEQMGVASGISLMVEQEPLLKRAEGRRSTYRVYEKDLAYRTLCCAGNHYGKPALVSASEKGDIMTAWPQPRLAVLTQDILEVEAEKVRAGVSSHLMMVMNLYGMTREEALEYIEQIKEDTEELTKLFPEVAAVNAPPDPAAEADAEHQRNLEAIEAAKKGD